MTSQIVAFRTSRSDEGDWIIQRSSATPVHNYLILTGGIDAYQSTNGRWITDDPDKTPS